MSSKFYVGLCHVFFVYFFEGVSVGCLVDFSGWELEWYNFIICEIVGKLKVKLYIEYLYVWE